VLSSLIDLLMRKTFTSCDLRQASLGDDASNYDFFELIGFLFED